MIACPAHLKLTVRFYDSGTSGPTALKEIVFIIQKIPDIWNFYSTDGTASVMYDYGILK